MTTTITNAKKAAVTTGAANFQIAACDLDVNFEVQDFGAATLDDLGQIQVLCDLDFSRDCHGFEARGEMLYQTMKNKEGVLGLADNAANMHDAHTQVASAFGINNNLPENDYPEYRDLTKLTAPIQAKAQAIFDAYVTARVLA